MLSNQVLHKTVQSIYHVTGLECSVWDIQGNCLVTTREKEKELEKEVEKVNCLKVSVEVKDKKHESAMEDYYLSLK